MIRKILKRLGLWEEKTPVERVPPITIRKRRYEPFDDGWLQYEDSLITVHWPVFL